ncbi:hypothetical protein PA598K_05228 [Paenibacillus sp. 598K]|uniref:alpha/beta hydrolase n=1 Tax=Paenibacillus sp. 598K TaxID=1117987 RepID=UPI000FFAB239|nr:alpha/beta hydrolase-fold protein [Paenibacillus sp. 598K]GBF76742.1 hypothetical protein PA598K_05228 [Paenibacillus sp. 598K]
MSTGSSTARQVPHSAEYRVIDPVRQLDYRILIARPAEPPPPEGYPVIYALDGDAVFDTLAEAVRLQTRKPRGYEPAVIVGIAYPSGEPFDMPRRCLDFTTPAPAERLPVRPDGSPWPERGDAARFLDFIERTLMPFIGRELPVDSSRQAIFGHSLGGLFVLYAMFARPGLFRHCIAGSPSIWWDQHAIVQAAERFDPAALAPGRVPRLLLTVGSEELAHMVADAKALADRLAPLAEDGFHSACVVFADETHISVLPAAISRLVRFVLSPQEG